MYATLVKSTEDVALAILPKKRSRAQAKPSHSVGAIEARYRLQAVSLSYHRSPSQSLKIQLIEAKKKLDDAYLNAEFDFINGKLCQEHISKKHHLALKTIKEISDKNSGSSVRIKWGVFQKAIRKLVITFSKTSWKECQNI